MATTQPVTEDESIPTLLSQLVDDARGLASAEIALVKARVGERASAYRNAAIFFVAAAVLALAGLIALLVGLILSLATLIGPGLATAAVVITVFAIAGVLAIIGKGRLAPGTAR
ncbi:phage holin family protein [Sphingomonas kyungheensis]|uniref:Phage holin family protein n=1 Tax=Sphingomonas kyungheensis TaxID=1069987 RepID=A0ABU8H0T0_9SPHN